MRRNLLPLFVSLILYLANLGLSAQNKPVENADYRLAERFSPTKISKMVFSTKMAENGGSVLVFRHHF